METQRINGFQLVEDKCLENKIGPIIKYNFDSCCVDGVYLWINSSPLPISEIECFYVFPGGNNEFDVKVFYKDASSKSLGRTRDHEGAKKWIEGSNELIRNSR